ncbi:hypothetical protein SNOG_10675 [Parastagonospora nodorum SN15]|uniref:Uncharacterized protein n=2 Tax=Phaeosphaeria nodorum (strain SN15 / ATCC MYA-4574 / FGSC 10173) TaxID=321614 RepID=A0A7U2FGA5_PHANO|nr:hypothetical protein SNOG_10675 [Parastagonospora nodorum SN15]EAT82069.2 hypothetical protein SNOG_10675 [Parastagonospora nodorum SN15]QRD04739.1 hypothetical protein JI435_106750 [Parastagonospora nodorum SN15]
MVRIIFNVRGTDYPHDLLRRLLVTSKYITNNGREQAAGRKPELRLKFNLRHVGHMWRHYWANKCSTEKYEYDCYLDLLACLCLSHCLGDDTFEEAVRTTIIGKLRIGSDQAIFIACLNEFEKKSSVRAIIVNVTAYLVQRNGYPRGYVTAVAAQAFEEMLCFNFSDHVTESEVAFMPPKSKEKPATWEILASRLKPRVTGDINACRK